MNTDRIRRYIEELWDDSIVPELAEYIRIPNKSPHFDPDWAEHGYMDAAVEHMVRWCEAHALAGMRLEVVRLPGRTPLILIEVPGESDDCLVLYGHLDKQPEMTGWRGDLGPWTPKIEGDRLYGRGGADDGYAIYGSLAALGALHEQGIPHARCVVIIEACEESGSYDLPHYIEALRDRVGTPSLVVCLDSGCGDYERLWCTTSLRGLAGGALSVEMLREGVHSGDAGGVVPSTFRILRQLLSRVEDERDGRIVVESLHAQIPAAPTGAGRGSRPRSSATGCTPGFPSWTAPARPPPIRSSSCSAALGGPRSRSPAPAGLPELGNAGNVARPCTTAKLSLRLPPTCNPEAAADTLRELLERDPPHGARVRFSPDHAAPGWEAPPVAPWLDRAVRRASATYFGPDAVYMGEGGSIPFMGMLGEKFPQAQFLVTGVLGPESNAHGPNEFLHIPTGKRLTCCVAEVIAAHHARATTA